ncbi:hypothetical protein DL240_01875 [Lujinxingia litoralis]|uniref:Uncharacterized protein n=1 Tax=Lujinxingia litoralis TaxID=2211119 RepID=A0A328CDX3_9DELT|nr:hypothetical protein [Lujinxingia litoralis]RAL24983.1 hypothetical protein DL240_01875 [Lujinxingia litoralis]
MAAHYSVKVSCDEAKVELHELAIRVAAIAGRSPDEIQVLLEAGDVAIADSLSYAESLELQRELVRKRIPCRVVAQSGAVREVLLQRRAPTSTTPALAAASGATSGGAGAEVGKRTSEDGANAVGPAAPGGENPWAEFFPDLQEVSEAEGAGADLAPQAAAGAPVQGSAPATAQHVAAGEDARSAKKGQRAPEGSTRDETPAPLDASRLSRALGYDEERPPYAPRGYDPRPEHVPLIAAVLSVLAPGAGQVFNGEPERAQRYAWSFFLLWPWYRSVREAWEHGEQIRTWYAPRPEPGEGRRAMRFALNWWAALAVVGGLLAVTWGIVEEQRAQELRHAEAQLVAALVDAAVVDLEDAHTLAVASAGEAAQALVEARAAFTMDDDERAQRLYIIGYQSCVQRDYPLCEATMKRVTALSRDNRDAFRLQAWASMQAHREDRSVEIPEVAPVPSLEEFELQAGPGPDTIEEL